VAEQDALVIEQVRSAIGASRRQREILRGLGLRRIGHRVERPDTPGVRGAIRKVDHLVVVHPASQLLSPAPATGEATTKRTAKKKKGTKKTANKTTKTTTETTDSGSDEDE